MKKIYLILLISVIFSCNSIDDWGTEPVLTDETVNLASEYVVIQERYIELIRDRSEIDIKDNLTLDELDRLLLIEKKIALSSKRLINSWFDFNLLLRQDPGFNRAYKGHYLFRKAIDALHFSEVNRDKPRDLSIKESQYYYKVLLLEGECRLAIGQLVANNNTKIDTAKVYKELKKIYRVMD